MLALETPAAGMAAADPETALVAEVVGSMLQGVSASLSLNNPLLGVGQGTPNTRGETYTFERSNAFR